MRTDTNNGCDDESLLLLKVQRRSSRCAAAEEASKKIQKHVQETRKWLEKEKAELAYNISQAHQLLHVKERVELMAKSLEQPMEISQETLFHVQQSRRLRPSSTQPIKDTIEQSLLTENETIRENYKKLQQQIDKLTTQLKKLFEARHDIETDMGGRADAQNTEECVKLLCALDIDVELPAVPSVKNFSNAWIKTTKELIQKSQDERDSAQILQIQTNQVMLSCANQSFDSWYDTNFRTTSRIKELVSVQEGLLNRYHRVCLDIEQLHPKLIQLQEALDANTSALKTAQSRVEKRTKKLDGLELCRDKIVVTLIREMHLLKLSVSKLTLQLAEVDGRMKAHLKSRAALEKEIRLNDVSIFAIRDKCLYLQQSFPMPNFADSVQSLPKNFPRCTTTTTANKPFCQFQ